jgi:transcriptional regulator with XRE-family HTH domain
MFLNRHNGRNNWVGIGMKKLRKNLQVSQREISDRLQKNDINVDKNAVQRMESGDRFITDIELIGIMKTFNVTLEQLIDLSKD